jgi:hypothetical protein
MPSEPLSCRRFNEPRPPEPRVVNEVVVRHGEVEAVPLEAAEGEDFQPEAVAEVAGLAVAEVEDAGANEPIKIEPKARTTC